MQAVGKALLESVESQRLAYPLEAKIENSEKLEVGPQGKAKLRY
jgi:hypothetical protein